MRIGALRVWVSNAVHQSAVAARRVGTIVARKIRAVTSAIEGGVGVGDDESEFGGGRNRAWIQEVIDDARKKILALLEKSVFERFPRFEKFVRRLIGSPAPTIAAPPAPKRIGPVRLGAHTPDAGEVDHFKRQIQQGLLDAHQREHAGLRDRVEKGKKS